MLKKNSKFSNTQKSEILNSFIDSVYYKKDLQTYQLIYPFDCIIVIIYLII